MPPIEVSADTNNALKGFATGDQEVMGRFLETQLENADASGLSSKCYALVKIATLIAVDAPPASFIGQVPMALEAGVTPDELLGVLIAVAPQVGLPKVIGAAPEIALALGLPVDEWEAEEPQAHAG